MVLSRSILADVVTLAYIDYIGGKMCASMLSLGSEIVLHYKHTFSLSTCTLYTDMFGVFFFLENSDCNSFHHLAASFFLGVYETSTHTQTFIRIQIYIETIYTSKLMPQSKQQVLATQ